MSPYGLGWSTQIFGDHALHWHYGYGDSYSALIVRLPEKKTSFIFLSNTGAASAPFLLGYGNLLTSPFAISFLDHVLPEVVTEEDRINSRAFLHHYTETAFARNQGEAKRLLHELISVSPSRWERPDRAMIFLLSKLGDKAFLPQVEQLAQAYRASGDYHPEVTLALADYFEQLGMQDRSGALLHEIANRDGYGEEGATREACTRLGRELIRLGELEKGRNYIWKAARQGQTLDTTALPRIVRMLQPSLP